MNYEEARKYIDSIAAFGSKLGLDNITTLMKLLGDPQKKLKFVHVAGTNGKGSTVAYLSSILIRAGFRTGIYTSPFVENFSERIRINDEEISEEEFAFHATRVRQTAEKMIKEGLGSPTEFELICAIAFLYFAEKNCEICVLEVGMGGRLDATNVIDQPLLCIITPISFDHMEYLGDTLEKIAYEKAGIIKDDTTVLTYPQTKGVEEVLEDECRKHLSRLIRCTLPEEIKKADINGIEFEYEGTLFKTRILGIYQINNAAMAITAAKLLRDEGLDISDEDIIAGIDKALWKARFEILRKDPFVIIDGSHNLQGMETLSESLKLYFGDKKIIFIIGILKDKEYGKMLDRIMPLASRVFTVTVPSPRTLTADELAFEASKRTDVKVTNIEDPAQALKEALKEAADSDVICACGSLYFVGIIRRLVCY